MIVMFLANPVAFVCCLLSGMCLMGIYDVLGYGEPDEWFPFAWMVAFYFIAVWVLPWWTRPTLLWRWWRER